jgi:hypothetical protein
MNVPFCIWLWMRSALHRDQVEIMVHEPNLAFGEGSWRQNVAAVVHRLMNLILLRAVNRVWIAIPAWETRCRPYALGRKLPFHWLPVPSNVPVTAEDSSVARVLDQYLLGRRFLVGHFGIFPPAADGALPEAIRLLLDRCQDAVVLLMGKGSREFRAELVERMPQLAQRIQATGTLSPKDLSDHLVACHLLLQPYGDGISTRRGTTMASLAHGVPLVATRGHLTEEFWDDSGAVVLAPAGDTPALVDAACRLLADPAERARMHARAKALYDRRFDIRHVISALRQTITQPDLQSSIKTN